jgi:hypothetical protein
MAETLGIYQDKTPPTTATIGEGLHVCLGHLDLDRTMVVLLGTTMVQDVGSLSSHSWVSGR